MAQAVVPREVTYGAMHTAAAYQRWLGDNELYNFIFVSQVNHGIFANNFDDAKVPIAAAIVWAGHLLYKQPRERVTRSNLITGVTGDLAQINLSATRIKTQADARTHFLLCMNTLTTSEHFTTFVDVQLAAVAGEGVRYATFVEAYTALIGFVDHCTRNVDFTGTSIFVHLYLAIMKRGAISPGVVEKIEAGIVDDCGYRVAIDVVACRLVYKYYGGGIDDTNIAAIIEHLGGLLPASAIRLRQTLNQASGSGITAILVIGRALKMYPTFQWSIIKRMFPTEWTHLVTALRALNGNAWYGFRRDLGPVRSTAYKSLGYIAKELLVRVNGENTLNQYGGWARNIAGRANIDLLIAEYAQAFGERRVNLDLPPLADPGHDDVGEILPLLTVNDALFQ